MKFGVALTTRGRDATAETLARVSRKAEEYGFDSVWVTDHIVIPTRITSAYPYEATGTFDVPANEYYLEPLTVLAYLAGVTQRIRLGTGVLVVPYRNPVVLAKVVASLDVLSGGRVILGVGVGWMEEEFRALGLDTFGQRGAVTDETIRLLRELWTQDEPRFAGRFFRVEDVRFSPKPVQKPHPPIWIGGHTPAALRRAALLGDGWHPIGLRPPVGLHPDEYAQAVTTLRRLAGEAGRDPGEIALTFRASLAFTEEPPSPRTPFIGSPTQILEDIRTYARLGVSHLVFGFRGPTLEALLEQLQRFAVEIRPAASDLP
ncbi:MAG: LLM class F420-dependent oxidoreductase [candidate division NC10 bacterium]|nr:LLM class F420-dependent oxidoreductase [candidate division NC10 bacterium]